jgi:5-methylcytosine-specific restriction protein A
MPNAPLKPCLAKGCGALVTERYCPRHGTTHKWDERRPEIARIRGAKLQQMRQRLFQRHPLCEPCEAAGRLTLATIRDHRIPLAEGGTEDEANEQAICASCHEAKTQEEARRGRG